MASFTIENGKTTFGELLAQMDGYLENPSESEAVRHEEAIVKALRADPKATTYKLPVFMKIPKEGVPMEDWDWEVKEHAFWIPGKSQKPNGVKKFAPLQPTMYYALPENAAGQPECEAVPAKVEL